MDIRNAENLDSKFAFHAKKSNFIFNNELAKTKLEEAIYWNICCFWFFFFVCCCGGERCK